MIEKHQDPLVYTPHTLSPPFHRSSITSYTKTHSSTPPPPSRTQPPGSTHPSPPPPSRHATHPPGPGPASPPPPPPPGRAGAGPRRGRRGSARRRGRPPRAPGAPARCVCVCVCFKCEKVCVSLCWCGGVFCEQSGSWVVFCGVGRGGCGWV